MIAILDVPRENLSQLLALCNEWEVEILDRIESGPAGGNPRLTLLVGNANALRAIGDLYFGPSGRFGQ